ncbi:MAG: peptidylprolyl isomerase [Bacteroidales bacterium]|nr:peptidylprolyl isomerase [Bacteroidales bacterium]
MLKKAGYSLITLIAVFLFFGQATAQNSNEDAVVIDEVVGVVGDAVVLKSDLETQFLQSKAQAQQAGMKQSDITKCGVLEDLLYEKLLLHKAQIDSLEVTDSQVEQEMDRRFRFLINQFGSQEKMEEFYGKTIVEFKDELRDMVREQLMAEKARQTITTDVRVTPSEVKSFYKNLPQDSIPRINTQYEIAQIVKEPPISNVELEATKSRLRRMRERIINGESFSTLAVLYSQDKGTAKEGGDLGLVKRGELFPEVEAAAFRLKEGEVSNIVRSEVGYHIVKLLERRGEYVRIRHILLRPEPSPEDLEQAKNELDSIAKLIRTTKLTFEEAAEKFSDHPSKVNGGMLVNDMTGNTRFSADQLDPNVYFVVNKMDEGEISKPVLTTTDEGTKAYRILYLKLRTEPHIANLEEDYEKVQQWAREQKKSRVMRDWVNKKRKNTYVKINEKYLDCNFRFNWNL